MTQYTFLVTVDATSERLARGLITAAIVKAREPCLKLQSVVNAKRRHRAREEAAE